MDRAALRRLAEKASKDWMDSVQPYNRDEYLFLEGYKLAFSLPDKFALDVIGAPVEKE